MAKVTFRQAAIEDLNTIWDYTFETWSEQKADRYYATIKMNCQGIAISPFIGKVYDGIRPDLLGLKVEKHIIFYQVISKNHIEVIRILHERMDLKHRISKTK